MEKGDKVKMSNKNQNAYDGMEGTVTDVFEDNSFALNCGNSTLVVPMRNYFGKIKGVWIYLNDKLIYHKRKSDKIKICWYKFLGADI
jgi:translation initiation factor IF-1